MKRILYFPLVFAMVSIVPGARAEVINLVDQIKDFGTVTRQADGVINDDLAYGDHQHR